MLENLFTSKTRTRILGTLILNPGREFHLREISREIGITPTYVKKELQNLEELNLVLKAKKGNLILFQINRDSILYGELKSMFLKTEYFGELLKKSLKELKIDFAFIFGSFAKGIESVESDIDFCCGCC